MIKVAILQRDIPHYRIRFFEEVAAQASATGMDVILYSAETSARNAAYKFAHKSLPVHLFTKSKNGPFWMKGLTAALKGSDVIVAPQELQCLNVPYLWAIRHRLCKTWIWWGHGYNFQASVRSFGSTKIKEAIKHFMTRRADGLITYTAGGADYWRKRGMPEDRVIPYYNTIDVEGLRKTGAEVTEEQRKELRHRLRLEGKRVLLFSGRLYAEKKVDFLLRAFALLKKAYPHVALLIIGDGEERRRLEQLAAELALQDVHFLGELVDPKDTAAYFSLADAMVIPGLVGLAIVHGFAYSLPMITTQHDFHSPEIEYLSPQCGVISEPDPIHYSGAILRVLENSADFWQLRQGAFEQGSRLYIKDSAERFLGGVAAAFQRAGSHMRESFT